MREAREETLGALRQRYKTASRAVTAAAERFWAERGQTQPVEGWQFTLAPVQASPRTLGEICPHGQILAPASLFSFGPCTARFLFSPQAEKKENGGCIAPAIIMAEILPAR